MSDLKTPYFDKEIAFLEETNKYYKYKFAERKLQEYQSIKEALNRLERLKTATTDQRQVHEVDLREYGFEGESTVHNLITEDHKVQYSFYDVGRLIIEPLGAGNDSVYLEDFWTMADFTKLIRIITGHTLKKKNQIDS